MAKILLVEDESNIRLNTKIILENAGFTVFSAEDGKDGITLAKEIIPDIVVCDIMLPGISGYDVLNTLIKDPKTLSIPFIFLTAKAEMQDLRTGMALGADDYIVKPFKSKDLINSINARLNKANLIKNTIKPVYTLPGVKQNNDHIMLTVNNKPQLIKIADIACISAKGEYSRVFLSNGTNFLICKILKKWESVLPQNCFVRTHRSTIVNLGFIEKIEKWYKRSYKIHIRNVKDTFIISQRYASKLKDKISF